MLFQFSFSSDVPPSDLWVWMVCEFWQWQVDCNILITHTGNRKSLLVSALVVIGPAIGRLCDSPTSFASMPHAGIIKSTTSTIERMKKSCHFIANVCHDESNDTSELQQSVLQCVTVELFNTMSELKAIFVLSGRTQTNRMAAIRTDSLKNGKWKRETGIENTNDWVVICTMQKTSWQATV